MHALVNYGRQEPLSDGRAPVTVGNGRLPSGAPLLAAALNALASSIAIIDANGFIVAVNDAWRRHAVENGMRWSHYGIGHNYLSVFDTATRTGDDRAAQIALGIRQVLAGRASSYQVEYSYEAPSVRRFNQCVTPFDYSGVRHAIISHENVTLDRLKEDELRAAREVAEAGWREEEMRHESAENRARIAEAVADMLAIASSGLRLEDALQGMVERAGETLRSEAAAIYSAEERWDRLVLVAGCGALRTTTSQGKSPIVPSILARAIADHRGISVNDVRQDPAVAEAAAHAPARQPGYRALLVTPVQNKDSLYGYLVLFYTEPHEFGEDDMELAYRCGQQVTLALANAELRSRAEKTAIENERGRLARDLHDAVTQTLFSASVVAEALPRVWERDPEEGRRALEELRLWTRGALAEMRTLLMELRPAALIEKPLPDLLRQLSEAAATRLCIPAVCHVTAEAEPPAEVKLSLYRIAQEALNNMAKHSCASRVEIRYLALPQAVQLAIVDDGRGFDLGRSFPGRWALGPCASGPSTSAPN